MWNGFSFITSVHCGTDEMNRAVVGRLLSKYGKGVSNHLHMGFLSGIHSFLNSNGLLQWCVEKMTKL